MNLQVRTLLIAIVVPTAAAAVDSGKAKVTPPRHIASVLEELAPVHRHRLSWPKAEPPHCPPSPRRTEA